MNPRNLMLVLAVLLVVPTIHAITLDELIGGFDFTYDVDDVNVSEFSVKGNDTGGSSLFDQLIINLTVETGSGNYSFIGDLFKDGVWVTTITEYYVYEPGAHTALLIYDPSLLQNGSYNLTLTIQQNFLTLYRKLDALSIAYDNDLFVKPAILVGVDSFNTLDNDSDADVEFLQINLTINATDAGEYRILGLVRDANQSIGSQKNVSLGSGTNTVSLEINGSALRRERLGNATVYQVLVQNGVEYFFDVNFATTYDLLDFDTEESLFTDTYEDGAIDLDGDNLSDLLQLNISLFVKNSGVHSLELELTDAFGEFVLADTQNFTLSAGSEKVRFQINGTRIFRSSVNGPYVVNALLLKKGNVTIDSVADAYTTQSYDYSDFAAGVLADLTVDSARSSVANITLNVKNQGDAYAFGATITAFDANFTKIDEGSVGVLAPNSLQTVTLQVNTTNNTNVFLIADFANAIEESDESNNLVFIGTENGTVTFSVTLPVQWNLISLPINVSNKTIASVFNGVNVSFVFGWNSSLQNFTFFENETDNNFDVVGATQGIWVKPDNETALSISGLNFSYPIAYTLRSGWNLISYAASSARTLSDALGGVNASLDLLFSYQNDTWLSFNKLRNNSQNTLVTFKPGFGYWVKVSQDVNWSFNGTFS